MLDAITESSDLPGSGLQNSAKTFPGARVVVDKTGIEQSGAAGISDRMRRISGVQSVDNSGMAGHAIG